MIESLAALHPFLVHFAVAFTLAGAALDCASFFQRLERVASAGPVLIGLAAPFLLAAALTGNLAEGLARPDLAGPTLDAHVTAANSAVWIFFAAALFRLDLALRKRFTGFRRVIYCVLMVAAAVAVFIAAREGGRLRHRGYNAPAHAQASFRLDACPPPLTHSMV